MTSKSVLFKATILITALMIGVAGCKKDDEDDNGNTPTDFTLSSIEAGGIDLNAATPPSDVPVDPTIDADFSTSVDASSVNENTVTMTRGYDNESVALDLSVSGNTITISPVDDLGNGATYTLSFDGVKSTDGQTIGAFNRSFTTEGTFVPAGQVAYYNFDGDANDQVGNYDPMPGGVIDVDFVSSFKTEMGQAASFNGNTSLIRIPDGDQLNNTDDFTLSFWVHANADQVAHFVMGLAGWNGFQFEIMGNAQEGEITACKLAAQYEFADGTSGAEDLWYNGTEDLGWQGWTYARDLTGAGGVHGLLADEWAHVVCRYNSETKVGSLYINGELMKEQDFNLWPDDDPKYTTVGLTYAGNPDNNVLVFGFIQDFENPTIPDDWADYSNPDNNHFYGMLDNVRFWHTAISDQEITLMYDSEKP